MHNPKYYSTSVYQCVVTMTTPYQSIRCSTGDHIIDHHFSTGDHIDHHFQYSDDHIDHHFQYR